MSIVQELKPNEVQILLRKLFIMYASYGTRSNHNLLRSAKFQKLLSDANVTDNRCNQKQIDIIFYSGSNRNPSMTFERFLEALVKIAEVKWPNMDAELSLKKLLNENLLPLYGDSDQGDLDPELGLNIEPEWLELLASIFPVLQELHQMYWPWEQNSNERHTVISKRSQRAFHTFMQEFDICPTLVSKSSIFALWCDLVVMESMNPKISAIIDPCDDKGKVFTLTKFLMSIYLSALMGYQDDTQISDRPNIEKLLLLLERMELSKGFMWIETKTNKPHMARMSMLPTQEIISRALSVEPQQFPETEANEELPVSDSPPKPAETPNHFISYHEEDDDDASALSLDEPGLTSLEQYLDSIQQIFTAYCSYGDPMNTNRLKSARLVKMLKDCGIYKNEVFNASVSRMSQRSPRDSCISMVDIDLIFAKLTGSNRAASRQSQKSSFNPRLMYSRSQTSSQGRMEFQQFLKALEYIAVKINPDKDLDQAYIYLLENHILTLLQGIQNTNPKFIDNLMEVLKDPEVVDVLNHVHKSIIYYYNFYADSYGFLNFDNFIRLCRDFAIFPQVVSKPKLLRFFQALASIHAQTEDPNGAGTFDTYRAPEQTDSELIDEHLFIEGLVLISNEVIYKDPVPTPMERICYLMERMSQSNGPLKVRQAQGANRSNEVDILSILRHRYPENFQIVKSSKRSTFADLMKE